jgi:hypothetical protein
MGRALPRWGPAVERDRNRSTPAGRKGLVSGMTLEKTSFVIAIAFLSVSAGACGSSGGGDCTDTQVAVSYLGGASDGKTECKSIPSGCGSKADCSDQACISALYALCASPYIGAGCSDTAPPTILSCNP